MTELGSKIIQIWGRGLPQQMIGMEFKHALAKFRPHKQWKGWGKLMESKMGAKITALRRAKGMTQEQLAAALGVSGPAVSKWETGSSCPDITLLCPLARALGTNVDTLLSFEEELSQEDLGKYMGEIIELAREGKISRAEERLNGLLHRYPTDIPLKFSAIGALSFFTMNRELGEEGQQGAAGGDTDRWTLQKKELAQALCRSGDPTYYFPALSMLVSLHLEEGELEEAEELLKENQTNTEDFTVLWVRLYLKKGQRNQALHILQKQAYKLVGDLRTCLMGLLGEEISLEQDRALEICRILEQIDSLFSVGGNLGAGLAAEVYLRGGEQEKALACLERLADQMTRRMDPPNPLVFAPSIAPDPEKLVISREIRLAILQGLEKDACYEPLRGRERFQALLRLLRMIPE